MLFHIRRSPDETGGGVETPPDAGGATKPEDTVAHWQGRAESHHRDLVAMKAQLAELTDFKAKADKAASDAADADLAAKGEYETLAAQKDSRIEELTGKVDAYAAADKARADAVSAKLEDAIAKRTDADEMRGKLIRLVGDDPHRQWDLFQELTGTPATGTTAPDTQTPDTGGGAGNGFAALTTEEVEKCRLVHGQMGRSFEDQCKWLQEQKARIAANPSPWEQQNAAEAAKNGGV